MAFFDRLRDAFGVRSESVVPPPPAVIKRAGYSMEYINPAVSPGFSGFSGNWSQDNYTSLSTIGYRNCVIAYRCVAETSEMFASIPWVAYRRTKSGRDRVVRHRALDVMENPNPSTNAISFRHAWCSYLLIAGWNTLQLIESPTGRGPLEMWNLPPDRMTKVYDGQGRPVQWRYEYADKVKTWPINPVTMASPILETMLFNPLDPTTGQSPMTAARRAIDTHNSYTKWNKNLLDNAAVPSGALSLQDEMSDTEFEDFRAEFERSYASANNARRPMVLEGGITWVPLAFAPTDMDWLDGQNLTALDICRAFGVPGPILSITDPTYNNMKEARISFLENRIVGLLQLYKSMLNMWYTPLFGDPNLELDYDLSQVPAFADRRDLVWERAKNSADILTINERRKMVDYPPIEGGDAIMVHSAMTPQIGPDAIGWLETPNPGEAPQSAMTPAKPGETPDDPEDDDEPVRTMIEQEYRAALVNFGWPDDAVSRKLAEMGVLGTNDRQSEG